MKSDLRCDRCGAELAGQAVGGQCGNCLLNLALNQTDPGEDFTVGIPSLPTELGRVRYFGDYELLEEIARGGMGIVYRARQASLNRIVALKMILSGNFSSASVVQRFQAEAEAAARLDHPNIVPIHEIGQHEGQQYFSMRYLEGGTLTEAIKGAKFAPRKAAELMIVVARAVHYAHQHGIVHRDLKPGNILLDSKGEPHVADFGLAKLLESDSEMTQSQAVLGTPSYMAPEQASGASNQATTASDVYSLGAIFYELLTGKPPFKADSAMNTLQLVLKSEPVKPRLLNAALDRDIETVCLKCLEKDPQSRYASADALAEDLQRWHSHHPVLARPSSAIRRTVKWARRRPTAAALLVVSCLTVLAFGGIFSVDHLRKEERELRKETQEALLRAERAQQAEAGARREEAEQRAAAEAAREAESAQRQRAEAENQKSVANLYLATIAWAELEAQAKNLDRVTALLDACPPHLRHWEWHYLKRRSKAELAVVKQYDLPIRNVRFGPQDGSIIALPFQGLPKYWNPQTGDDLATASGGTTINEPGAVADQGKFLAKYVNLPSQGLVIECLEFRGGVYHFLWSHPTGDPATVIRTAGQISFSRDSRVLATLSNERGIIVWDVSSGKEVKRFPATEPVNGMSLSAGGEMLAWSTWHVNANRITEGKVWTSSLDDDFKPVCLGAFQSSVLATGWSPDSKWLAAGLADGTVAVWDMTASPLAETAIPPPKIFKEHTDAVFALAFSPNSKLLASGGADRDVLVLDLAANKLTRRYSGHSGTVRTLDFNLADTALVSGGDDSSVRVWDLITPPGPIVIQEKTLGLAFSPDGNLLTSGNAVWSALDGELLKSYTNSLRSGRPAFSSDGELIASGPKIVATEDGKTITTIRSGWGGGYRGSRLVYGVAFSSDTSLFAAGHGDSAPGDIKLFDPFTGEQKQILTGHTNPVWDVAFSPDGSLLASASGTYANFKTGGPGEAGLWRVSTGEMIQRHASGFALYSICFSGDGRFFAASGGAYHGAYMNRERGEINVWEVSSGERVFCRTNLTSAVYSIALSPDGQRLVAGIGPHGENGPFDVILFDLQTEKETLTLGRHAKSVRGVAYSQDGKRIAAGGSDGVIQIWSID